VKACFDKIDQSGRLLEQFKVSLDVETMNHLRSEVELAAQMVDK
jgi:hypothetical protein